MLPTLLALVSEERGRGREFACELPLANAAEDQIACPSPAHNLSAPKREPTHTRTIIQ